MRNFEVVKTVRQYNETIIRRHRQKIRQGKSKQKRLKVAHIGVIPYQIRKPRLTGVDLEIMQIVAQVLEFEIDLVPAKSWGLFDEKSKTWNGLVGMVSILCYQ